MGGRSLSTNAILLGGVAFGLIDRILIPDTTTMFFVSAIGGVLIIMIISILVMLTRINFVIGIQHIRMRDIESRLGMERNWLIHGLDKKAKGKLDELEYSIAKKIKRVSEINTNKYTPPARRMVILILFSVIFLWVLIISFVNWPSFRFWINAMFFPPI